MSVRLVSAIVLIFGALSAAGDACNPGLVSAEKVLSGSIESAVYGDFDEDGRIDIAAVTNDTTRSVFLNRGGAYELVDQRVVSGDQSFFASSLVAADDVNRDGHIDLVYHGEARAYVALGHGTGLFDPLIPSQLEGANDWRYVDVDGDGRKDFVQIQTSSASLSVSRGDGTFGPPRQLPSVGTDPAPQVLLGDFDGDGHPDLYLAAYSAGPHSFVQTFWWNDGHGNLTTKTQLSTFTAIYPAPIVPLLDAYDFDGDGAADILFKDLATGSLTLTRVVGRTITTQPIEADEAVRGTGELRGVADFDGDGQKDALFGDGVVVWGSRPLSRIAATRFELLSKPPQFQENPNVTTADLDGDGIADIVGTGGATGLYTVRGRKGSRDLAAARITPGVAMTSFGMGDINGDGIGDIVGSISITDPRVAVYYGDGHGGYVAQPSIPVAGLDGRVALADLDGDGRLDLVFGDKVGVAFGDGAGGFGTPVLVDGAKLLGAGKVAAGTSAVFVFAGGSVQQVTFGTDRKPVMTPIVTAPTDATFLIVDVDGDGVSELLMKSGAGTQIVRKTSSGWSAGASFQLLPAALAPASVAAGDLDGDGRIDLAACDDRDCYVSLATASGYAAAKPLHFNGPTVRNVAVADADGDGRADVIALVDLPGGATIASVGRNAGGGEFVLAGAAETARSGAALAAMDLDGDGRPDLLLATSAGLEVVHSGCAMSRIRAAVTPTQPVEGGRATIVVNVEGPSGGPSGGVTIREGSRVIDATQPVNFGSRTFTTPALTAGRHIYTIAYDDQQLGHSEETLIVDVADVTPRRRNARH